MPQLTGSLQSINLAILLPLLLLACTSEENSIETSAPTEGIHDTGAPDGTSTSLEDTSAEKRESIDVTGPNKEECTADTDCPVGEICLEGDKGNTCGCEPSEETCDNKDNNCDGDVDEGPLCEDNLTCIDGECTCPPEQACGEACVDTQSDSKHCGACDEVCGSGQDCLEGTCQCEGDFTACGGSCVDLMVDLVHCGACDQLCKGGSTCKEGACTCTGPGQPQLCGDVCADLLEDPVHCGACDAACPEGAYCTDGICDCGEGATLCGDACVQPLTDSNHCGSCDILCAPGSTCVEGICTLPMARLLSPLSGKSSSTAFPTLTWEAGPGQTSARVEICPQPECLNPVLSQIVQASELTPETPLPPGLHYWRVQALTDGGLEGPYTAPWALMIGLQDALGSSSWGLVPDIGMDGVADLAVGACGLGDTCSTEAWIYHGPLVSGQEPTQVLSGGTNTLYGYATSLAGDLNGDGKPDLAVGSWLNYSIWVYLSQEDGLYEPYTLLQSAPGLFPMFGHDVAPAGDLNQDGYGDLITGDPIESAGYVYYGGPDGVHEDDSLTLYATSGGGITVAGGCDINGDGRDDAFVGGPPVLAVFANPGVSEPSQLLEKPSGNFGVAVDCAGDTNGDGFLDLVVGAGATNQTFVYLGGPTGLDPMSEITLEGTGNFGLGVAGIGDANGDGFEDVAVGGDGKVQVHRGSINGTEPVPTQVIEGTDPTFGNAVMGGRDVTGDGVTDLIIGSPGEGKTYLCEGSSDGFMEPQALNDNPKGGLGNSLGMLLP